MADDKGISPRWTYTSERKNRRDVSVLVLKERVVRIRAAILEVSPIFNFLNPTATLIHIGGEIGQSGAMYNAVSPSVNGRGGSASQMTLQLHSENDIEYIITQEQSVVTLPDSSFRFIIEELAPEYTKVTLYAKGLVSAGGFSLPFPFCFACSMRGFIRTHMQEGTKRLHQGLSNLPSVSSSAVPVAVEMVRESGDNRIETLERLVRLRDSGALTQAEFEAEKAKVLGTPSAPPVTTEIEKM